jgi:hypothetical protein
MGKIPSSHINGQIGSRWHFCGVVFFFPDTAIVAEYFLPSKCCTWWWHFSLLQVPTRFGVAMY